MRKSFVSISSLGLLLCSTSAVAQSGPWTVSEARGQVEIREQANVKTAQRGASVPAGAMVRTGATGNAVLVRGREFVTLRRNSQIRIPAANAERGVIQVLQDWGSALFNIGKQPNPHFGVETPYLAAVVKGTTFTITVAPEGASMQVLEGAVEAATLDGGARDLVMPGAVAMIAANDRLRLVVEGSNRKVIDSPARPAEGSAAGPAGGASLQPASYATAVGGSYGLVRSEPARVIDAVFSSGSADLSDLSEGFLIGETAKFAAELVADLATEEEPAAPAEAVVVPDAPEPEQPDTETEEPPVTDEEEPEPEPPVTDEEEPEPEPPVTDEEEPGPEPEPEDDGNNGHGNDDDRDDDSNPGKGGGRDDDRDDDNNPGKGGGRDDDRDDDDDDDADDDDDDDD